MNLINKSYYEANCNFVIAVKPLNAEHSKYRTPPNTGQKPNALLDLL